jgi:hypothetical protein
MNGAIPPLSQYAFMAWCVVKHRDNFTSTLRYAVTRAAYQMRSEEETVFSHDARRMLRFAETSVPMVILWLVTRQKGTVTNVKLGFQTL